MKYSHLILILLFVGLLNQANLTAQITTSKAIEEVVTHADTLASQDAELPIVKTVVVEEEAEMSTRDKYITGALAALGFVGVLVMRIFRKKKPRVPANKKE